MVPPVSFPRFWFAAGLILSLGACALPRNGPDYSEITTPAPPPDRSARVPWISPQTSPRSSETWTTHRVTSADSCRASETRKYRRR